jgi:nitrate/nitrite transporter NarK
MGWRLAFGGVVIFVALASIAVWLVVRDAPPGHPFLSPVRRQHCGKD